VTEHDDSTMVASDVGRSELSVDERRPGKRPSKGAISGKRWAHRFAFALSDRMRAVKRVIDNVAPTDVTVLVWGETGVGKEIVAWCLHDGSPRRDRPFVKVNCAALPLELLESELFGYERGAFTGAHRPKPGKFEQAHTGTIFLDEVGEMPLPVQAKLLQVLQDRQFSRLGSREDIRVDVRVLAATNKNLAKLVAQKDFREDLYYRLNVINLYVPSLRERSEEISILTDRFLDHYAREYRRPRPRLSAATIERFKSYWWPGNVRELENIITRIVVLGSEDWVAGELSPTRRSPAPDPLSALPVEGRTLREEQAAHAEGSSPPHVSPRADDEPVGLKNIVKRAAKEAERAELHRELGRAHWRRVEAARRLKISYRTLLRKIEENGL
jgi:two-component system response regulator AtoC